MLLDHCLYFVIDLFKAVPFHDSYGRTQGSARNGDRIDTGSGKIKQKREMTGCRKNQNIRERVGVGRWRSRKKRRLLNMFARYLSGIIS